MARTGSNKGSLSHPHSHSHPNSNSGSTTLANHGSGGHHKEEKEAMTVIDLVPGAPAPDRFAAVFSSQPNSSSSNKVTNGSDAEWTKAHRMTCHGGDNVVLVRCSPRSSKLPTGYAMTSISDRLQQHFNVSLE
ncbi:hypothetical protein GHT06_019033 [Daphnia sinensis]|uniref:Uncharacterized protein n=1 Tax=Daphnia sinensis TaxID=1820382 RepID=A0AAD5PR01_9CRUS|nr:hypothetical protein GHT06_019033 [Daphnia sinensis]